MKKIKLLELAQNQLKEQSDHKKSLSLVLLGLKILFK